jgi:hypothetical protein
MDGHSIILAESNSIWEKARALLIFAPHKKKIT